jgi:hypothetical protein
MAQDLKTGFGPFLFAAEEAMGNEVSASNQESRSSKQFAVAKGKKLRVATSVSPEIAAAPKVKKTKSPAHKRR